MTGYPPGVHDIPEADYFADPALSCSGAKLLLPPSCPAKFKWRQDHPEPYKRAWEYGTAAHRLVLGQGADYVILDYDNYRTGNAQQARDEARAAGAAPVLAREHQQILAMADAIRLHPLAGPLLDPSWGGKPEQSLFWLDAETGVPRRARADWLPAPGHGRYVLADYKTAASADAESFARAAFNYGYVQQHPWYCDGIRALGIDDDPAFLFVVQEKDAPYLVNIVELEPDARMLGAARNRRALEIFRDCTDSGLWPGYEAQSVDGITRITAPAWATRALEVAW
jgi:PDDEXK-like domain of unknown function (DUF3799)